MSYSSAHTKSPKMQVFRSFYAGGVSKFLPPGCTNGTLYAVVFKYTLMQHYKQLGTASNKYACTTRYSPVAKGLVHYIKRSEHAAKVLLPRPYKIATCKTSMHQNCSVWAPLCRGCTKCRGGVPNLLPPSCICTCVHIYVCKYTLCICSAPSQYLYLHLLVLMMPI